MWCTTSTEWSFKHMLILTDAEKYLIKIQQFTIKILNKLGIEEKYFHIINTTINIMPKKEKLNSFSLNSEQDKTDHHHYLFNPVLRVRTRRVGQ